MSFAMLGDMNAVKMLAFLVISCLYKLRLDANDTSKSYRKLFVATSLLCNKLVALLNADPRFS
jgi:hypothetical protein